MEWLKEFGRRMAMLLRWRKFHRELDEEMRLHRELRERDLQTEGLPADEARFAAHRRFGNELELRERSRDAWGWRWVEQSVQDVAFSLRQLRLNPGFATAAILSLALGIGANTAIFQLLNAVRLRTLPVSDPHELVEIRQATRSGASGSFFGWNPQVTYAQWELIQQQREPFTSVLAWAGTRFNVARGGEARYARGMYVSGDFFSLLGVQPLLGRTLTTQDDQRGCGLPAAVISYSYWQREFGGNPSAVGRNITLDNHNAEIVGVTPPAFFGPEPGRSYDVTIPLCAEELLWGEDTRITRRHSWWLTVMGRLKPGVTMEQASAYLNSVSPGIFEATLPEGYDETDRKNYLGFKLGAYPADAGVSQLRSQYEDSLWVLLGIAGLVLLIACANLANLMLARASARQREIAIRMALGASRGRLVRQLLSESLLLAASGAALGGLLAAWLSEALVAFVSTQRNQWMLELQMDWRILAFMAALTVMTCVLFGLTPAMRATRAGPGEALKAGGRGSTAGRERFGLRRALVVTQVSLSLVLVVGAMLFGRSFQKLVTQDVGLRQEGILLTNLNLNPTQVPQEQRLSFTQEMLEKVQGIPGVTGAAQVWVTPLSGSTWNNQVWMDGQSQQGRSLVWFNRVSESYFQTMGVPLLAGRNFDARDTLTAPQVAIVNEAFVRRYALGPQVVGMRFWRDQTAGSPSSPFEIIGLVKDSKYSSLREEEGQPTVYLPTPQDTEPSLDVTFLVRAEIPLESVSTQIKQVMAAVNPQIGVDLIVYKSLIGARLQQERLMATLSGFFGGLAAVLAAIGLYGVISYMVARRRGEIGIRMALGAQTRDVLRLILREAVVLVAIGLAAGTFLALAAGRAASSLLYGMQPYDAGAMAGAVVLLALVALLASYTPARRASRLDPVSTLREE